MVKDFFSVRLCNVYPGMLSASHTIPAQEGGTLSGVHTFKEIQDLVLSIEKLVCHQLLSNKVFSLMLSQLVDLDHALDELEHLMCHGSLVAWAKVRTYSCI